MNRTTRLPADGLHHSEACEVVIDYEMFLGEYYRMLRDAPRMPHVKALKAVARKRLEVIYAIMRDKVPYAA